MANKNVGTSSGSAITRLPIGLATHEFFHSGSLLHIHESRIPETICLLAPRVKPQSRIASTIFQRRKLPSWLTIGSFGTMRPRHRLLGRRIIFSIPGGFMSSSSASRREFLKLTGAGVASTALSAAAFSYAGILGANDRVRVATCGLRGRGKDHLHGFAHVPGTEIAALCDVDESVLNQRLADLEKLGLPKPKSYVDVRKLLADKDVDAVSIATPNHWHSLMAIWACQAGKDVYVEKPCSHNWFEARHSLP